MNYFFFKPDKLEKLACHVFQPPTHSLWIVTCSNKLEKKNPRLHFYLKGSVYEMYQIYTKSAKSLCIRFSQGWNYIFPSPLSLL